MVVLGDNEDKNNFWPQKGDYQLHPAVIMGEWYSDSLYIRTDKVTPTSSVEGLFEVAMVMHSYDDDVTEHLTLFHYSTWPQNGKGGGGGERGGERGGGRGGREGKRRGEEGIGRDENNNCSNYRFLFLSLSPGVPQSSAHIGYLFHHSLTARTRGVRPHRNHDNNTITFPSFPSSLSL